MLPRAVNTFTLGTAILVVCSFFVISIAVWSILTTNTLRENLPGIRGVMFNQTVLDEDLFARIPERAYDPSCTIEEVTDGLIVPWSIAFTSSERILITERSGTVRVLENDVLDPEPLAIFPQVSAKIEEGLMGLTLDPNYTENESPLRGAPVGIKPQGKPWTRNSVSDPAASGEVFDTNKFVYISFWYS